MSPPWSIRPVVVRQFMKTPSHALLFIFLRVPSAISGLSGLWSPGQPEIGLSCLDRSINLPYKVHTLLDVHKQNASSKTE